MLKTAPRLTSTYIFKVWIKGSPKVYRTLEFHAGQTLEDLHEMIQGVFNFENDHLYRFFLGSDPRKAEFIECEDAHRHALSSLQLRKGGKMIYLFDFGDRWYFQVKL